MAVSSFLCSGLNGGGTCRGREGEGRGSRQEVASHTHCSLWKEEVVDVMDCYQIKHWTPMWPEGGKERDGVRGEGWGVMG